MWKQIPLFLAFGLLAACGGGGGSGPDALPGAINSPPQITGVPPSIAQAGQLYEFTPAATDADGDTLTFRIENRPDWATFSPITGRLEGTPPSTAMSVYERVLISVSDGKSASELPAFSITVQGITPPANTPPTISGAPATSVVAGNAYEFVPQAADPDGQTLAFSITGKPTWASFDTVTGRLSGTPAAGDVGSHGPITIAVTDGAASASLAAFSIAVTAGTPPGPSNRPPTIAGTPAGAVAVGQAYSFTPSASDPDGQALTFSISNKPSWAT
ncbi:MAG: putative Ig domain-containing protein, partial [Gammaproteobacteria bacterium]|nr:putative Ig domain-containing protein [Gammaproteobacteria bacterium]